MACSLHGKLDAAVSAAKAAFDEAHEKDSLSDSDLNLLFVYYQGLKKIRSELGEHNHDSVTFNSDYLVEGASGTYAAFPDGCYDPDGNVSLSIGDADTVSVPDAISWNDQVFNEPITFNTQSGVTTVPEHEDDEKIVL